MATSKITPTRYLFRVHVTGSYSNLVNGFGVNTGYVAPDGYKLYQPVVVKTPNDNWITAYATKQSDTNISISGQNHFNGAISGTFTLLMIYEYIGE